MSAAQDTIGRPIESGQQRDAIHIAMAPVIAGEHLRPGQGIAFEAHSTERVRAFGTTIGIVDPFLSAPVEPGQRFWMFLYPNTITALRHDWTHPAFPQDGRPFVPAGAGPEERRLREIAADVGIDYFDMMDGADQWLRTSVGSKWGGDYIVQQGSETWRDEFPRYVDEFWRLYEIVRGTPVPDEHRQSFFSCSC